MSPLQAAVILNVKTTADPETIKAAYQAAVMSRHPDRGGSDAAMREVTEAYRILRRGVTVGEPDPAPTPPRDRKRAPMRPPQVPDWFGDLLSEVARPERASELGEIVGGDRVSAVQAGIRAFLMMTGKGKAKGKK
ncbi:MAG: J domain-containing protein [Candidatus Eisenbacteria bacterium]|nr:J domain-containing protein [Candidatus Eisenbacteria bacterium]